MTKHRVRNSASLSRIHKTGAHSPFSSVAITPWAKPRGRGIPLAKTALPFAENTDTHI
ncbi:hypothetical protein [Candidatus Methylobacter oryzae]|uniref:hypothetical protein n=1 Tax=Candidatus Methylobacter oryzae TaxID=2497749 RepID=UPI0012B60A50|nr:hypothetical protein [Candidatus Methylobacter oryzae]